MAEFIVLRYQWHAGKSDWLYTDMFPGEETLPSKAKAEARVRDAMKTGLLTDGEYVTIVEVVRRAYAAKRTTWRLRDAPDEDDGAGD